MNKILTIMLILALSVSYLVSCSNSQPAETDAPNKEDMQQTENQETEKVAEEKAEEPKQKLAKVTMQSEDGNTKIELTYNATFYNYLENTSNQGNFCINENDNVFMEKYEWPPVVAGGGEIFFFANRSAQDFHNERVKLNNQYNINVTDMEQLTISGKTAYVFKEDFYNNTEKLMPYIVFEIDDNLLAFLLPSGNWTNEDFLRDVGEFFVDAKTLK